MMREWFSISIMGYSMQGIILDMPLRTEVSKGKMIHTSIIWARVSKGKAVKLTLVCVSRRRDSNHLGTSVSRRQDISHAAGVYQEGKGPKQN